MILGYAVAAIIGLFIYDLMSDMCVTIGVGSASIAAGACLGGRYGKRIGYGRKLNSGTPKYYGNNFIIGAYAGGFIGTILSSAMIFLTSHLDCGFFGWVIPPFWYVFIMAATVFGLDYSGRNAKNTGSVLIFLAATFGAFAGLCLGIFLGNIIYNRTWFSLIYLILGVGYSSVLVGACLGARFGQIIGFGLKINPEAPGPYNLFFIVRTYAGGFIGALLSSALASCAPHSFIWIFAMPGYFFTIAGASLGFYYSFRKNADQSSLNISLKDNGSA